MPVSAFVLADSNAFYASCEMVFRPDIRNRAVIILGNNDGCVIARNRLAKTIAKIPMGAPLHQIQHLIRKHQVVVCSANFTYTVTCHAG